MCRCLHVSICLSSKWAKSEKSRNKGVVYVCEWVGGVGAVGDGVLSIVTCR